MKNEIIVYRPDALAEHIEVRIDEETVWLNRQQISTLFNRDVKTIGKHINNVFSESELDEKATVAKFATVQNEGGRTVERQVEYYTNQGIFFEGQVFDAYELTSKIIRSAKHSIILIDNYIDETTLVHLSKKEKAVKVFLLTKNPGKQFLLDLQKANSQYGNFYLKTFTKSHDRFLIIDDSQVYHLGASLKDLGKKWFAFSKLEKSSVESILNSVAELL